MNHSTWIVAVIAAFASGVIALLWRYQERVLFQPPPYHDPAGARRVDYRAADGQPLFAYVVGDLARATALGVLIAFHGNAALASWLYPWGSEVSRRTGRVVLLAEYRGYGGIEGRPTYATSRLDARAAYDFVRTQWAVPPERIALYGHSLGSAIATELAIDVGCTSLLLEAPFTSARDMARIFAPGLMNPLWALIARIHFDTERHVSALDCPVWVAHGTRDMVVPRRMGERVFKAARHPGELLIVPGAGHNDAAECGGDSYWRWIEGGASAQRGLTSP